MRDNFSAFEETNTKIVGISVDTAENSLKLQEKLELPFPLLTDTSLCVIEEFNAVDNSRADGKKIAKSLILIFKKGGEAVYRHISMWNHRPPASELIDIVKAL